MLNTGESKEPISAAESPERESLVKSRQRVADHGEVFTPSWLVEDMLDLVKEESERIDSRFLEPACGSGNFLDPVLQRKLKTVVDTYGKNEFEMRHFALLALMSVYGVEILKDNVDECRERLLGTFTRRLSLDSDDELVLAAKRVLQANIVHGDALAMTTFSDNPEPLTFPEWSYLGKGKFQRRDFRFDALTQASAFGEDTLFGDIEKHEIFQSVKDYPQMSIKELCSG